MEERKGAKAEREWNERGGGGGCGQRAIRVSAPALTHVPECWVGTARGLEKAGEGRGGEANPQSMRWAHFLPGIREKPGDGLVFIRTNTLTPPFHHHLAAPAARRLLLPWRQRLKTARVAPPRRCPGGGDRFLAAPERGREGLGLQRLPSDKLEAQTQDYPEKVLGGRAGLGGGDACL